MAECIPCPFYSLSSFLPYITASLAYLEFNNEVQLPALDDGISTFISIPPGLPFGAAHPMTAWVNQQ